MAFKRGSYNRVEDFLRGSHCIGFGGHVTSTDTNLFTGRDMGVAHSALRELFEELRLPKADQGRLLSGRYLKPVGLLNDDSSPVGRRHFAFLYRYEVSDDPAWDRPERGEKSVTQLRWLNAKSETVPLWGFEYWSQLCLREYFPWVAHMVTEFKIMRKAPLHPPHLLCVLGAVGSGKSEATRLLTREFGYTEINSGHIVAGLLGVPPVPTTPRDEFQRAAWDFIQSPDGPDRLATAIWRHAEQVGTGRVLVDGIRQRGTLARLKELAPAGRVGVLFVHTLPDLAYRFYRDREGRDCTIFDFLHVRNALVERDVERMIEGSDAVLYNWTGRREYQQAVRELMNAVEG